MSLQTRKCPGRGICPANLGSGTLAWPGSEREGMGWSQEVLELGLGCTGVPFLKKKNILFIYLAERKNRSRRVRDRERGRSRFPTEQGA